ncbi:UPF0688 protein C1orf174 homolog [Myxocyprinus asiaticus]|uniref:UPF0688 protein C1orf174 homolog n=1 Tax=Myxocyprinus asiaticus TaxID=70543 RepID=UPI0022228C83|nr:UPF0688 protein C1orf174 homolog [Myxocyprinus asiaticus]
MRAKQTVAGSHRRRGCGAVSLNTPDEKSSCKRAERSRVLRGLVQRSVSGIVSASGARQMAGDGGQAIRLPKRPFHSEGDENSSATMNENVKIHPGKKTPFEAHSGKERRGKENSALKSTCLTHCHTSGPAEAKMNQTVIHGSRVDPSIFFDEDSNHIFPVEQFFGNLDVVEDYPRRTPSSKRMSRREYRRMHYYAKEDSDDEQL